MSFVDNFRVVFARGIGVVFAVIGSIMLAVPEFNLAQDGVEFETFPIAGRAEVRAWYVGTALCISWILFSSELGRALQTIAIVLGGFAFARVVGYAKDGMDTNEALRLHQNGVFCLEVLGSSTSLFLLSTMEKVKTKLS
mmetsp:Transcript_10986/g.13753  ORF Transcript_10986/g.13753 Transcript_10986/m.13753 type:complete len:139 (+) Transcript_10986:86-502(+)|eukprot:CAMPEP_0204826780 /NCGR_PEP_ID=MMETSP1346-20131115/4406_1 /ASSEMBLY_ACC=CAM_ASM_000771 /TAXON_ID=215587 /ORGANISM="Aplanochytrium stocchinoi, Strain GSBS06" /LENGTH=138 /DNA_ID=CAMNT_0051954953 /DNA_START=19 /DNA_END=435 /DNA_ORIENTATION=+